MLLSARMADSPRTRGFDVEQLTMELNEELDLDAFRRAWEAVFCRHPILRARFHFEGLDEPEQEFVDEVQLPFVVRDWRGERDVETAQRAFLRADRRAGFHFDSWAPPRAESSTRLKPAPEGHAESDPGPLLRVTVFRLANDRFWAVWTFHHILLDGRSFILVLQDVFAAYEAFRRNEPLDAALSPPPRPFSDFVDWLDAQRAGGHFTRSLPFFRHLLFGKSAPTPLPPLLPSHDDDAGYGERSRVLSAGLTTQLRGLAASTQTTLATVVQAAWALYLARTTGDDDIVFGSTRACRHSAVSGEATSMVGLFINTLPVRIRIDESIDVAALLRAIRRQSLELREHEHTPLVDILGQADVPRGTPLFETLVMFESKELNRSLREGARREDDRLHFKQRHFRYEEQPTFPLSLTAFDGMDGVGGETGCLELRVLFDGTRFAPDGIERLLDHLEGTLRALARDSAQPLRDVDVLAPMERDRILFSFNDTTRSFPHQTLIHELFEARVDQHRSSGTDACAVVDDRGRISYLELEDRANQLAFRLRELGAGPDRYVGILLERSIDIVVALLAVAKAGAPYLPLDPDYPGERLNFMLADTGAPIVITQKALWPLVGAQPTVPTTVLATVPATVVLDEEAPSLRAYPTDRPARVAAPTDVCYAIYTSGSTGKPKGVILTHEAVVNTLDWVIREFAFTPKDRLLFVTSICFDLSVFDVFGTLGSGASVRIATRRELADPDAIVALLTAGEISVWNSAPAALARLLPFLPSSSSTPKTARLRLIMMSGDWIPVALPEQLRSTFGEVALRSLGGATEAAIWSNYYPIDAVDSRWSSIPYGQPIQNSFYHVLDHRLQPVPEGVVGDLFIGGTCLASGYLNRGELTAERFVDDPFAGEAGQRGRARPGHGKLYKTGDLARYFLDDGALRGQLEFLGRADFQVKIRGFRVELGEVEAVLQASGLVRDVVCAARADASGARVLVAWVVPKQRGHDHRGVFDVAALKDLVAHKVPEYMVPTHILVLPDGLPLSSNGKVDRNALPDPGAHRVARRVRPPTSQHEEQLLGIWREVLRRDEISVDESFFELGGHSLLATMLVSRIERTLGVRVPLSRLFSANTIEKLAASLDADDARDAGRQRALLPLHTPTNKAATTTPVLFVAGIGGHVFTFTRLAGLLGPDVPSWGFRAIGGESGEVPHQSVEEIAEVYEAEMKERGLLDAPCVLAGYSFGGFVAFELARRLRLRGVAPRLLVLFDVFAPDYPRRLPALERAWMHAEEWARRDFSGRVDYVKERVENVRRRLLERAGRADLLGARAQLGAVAALDEERQMELRALHGALTLAQVRYRPPAPEAVPMLLFKATVPFRWPATRFDDATHGWRDWLNGPITVVDIPGTHLQLFEGDNPERMARALRDRLR